MVQFSIIELDFQNKSNFKDKYMRISSIVKLIQTNLSQILNSLNKKGNTLDRLIGLRLGQNKKRYKKRNSKCLHF